jgi:phage repressor protein C with HTH and peptisase S24 domain
MLAMTKSDRAVKIGAAIRLARKRRGKVMRELAEHIGVETAAVGNWENGHNLPSTDNLLKLADFLHVGSSELGRGEVRFLDEQPELSDAEIVTDPAPFQGGPRDVRVLGASVGGDDGDFTFNGQVIGYVRRPPGIATLNDVFAVHVIGDSMEPRFEPGDMIYCSTRTPVPGDDIVIEMFPAEGETVGKAFIKRLVRRTKSEIVCRQYNPARELVFSPYEVKSVFRVIPLRELVGF